MINGEYEDERGHGPDGRRFAGSGQTAVERPHHDGDQNHERRDPGERSQFLFQGEGFLGEEKVGGGIIPSPQEALFLEHDVNNDPGRKHEGHENARNHPGDKKLSHGSLGSDSIDDHRHAGRNEDAQCPAPNDQARGQRARVSPFTHFGDPRRPDRRGGRRTGSAEGGEDRAGHDVGDSQAAGQPVKPAVDGFVKVGPRPGIRQDRTHEDEKRYS